MRSVRYTGALTLMLDRLHPEGVIGARATLGQRCSTRRTEGVDGWREEPEEGTNAQQSTEHLDSGSWEQWTTRRHDFADVTAHIFAVFYSRSDRNLGVEVRVN